ncbi:MAG: ATP synthase F1 subunit gamma [Patescibacteria group bacterium]
MASTQEFRRRIKSVNNTKQITKAMEMVASVKMQKSIKSITEARAYVQNSWNMLLKLANLTLPKNHPLLRPQETNKTAIIFVTSDRGLCGAYNSDALKKLTSFVKAECCPTDNKCEFLGDCDIIAVGKKGAEFVNNYKIGKLIAAFDGLENNISLEDIIPISKMSNGEYLNGTYSKVVIIYSHFVSSLKQIPVVKQVMPLEKDHIDLPELWESGDSPQTPERTVPSSQTEYKLEPNADTILEKLLYRFIRMQIYGAVLEANASEHSSRMVAMKNATDNAGNLIDDLTLTYNTIRQNSITNEIAEISGAAEAMR